MNIEAMVQPLSLTPAAVTGGASKVILAVVFFFGKTSIGGIKCPDGETQARIVTVCP